MKLSQEALVQLATEEIVFSESQDALDRLVLLVGPIFSLYGKDKRITGPISAEIVEKNFGLKLPNEVADALLVRLAQHNFVSSTVVGRSKIFFGKGLVQDNSKSSVIDDLVKDFRLFVSDKLLLPKITDAEILHLFMGEVFNLVDLLDNGSFSPKGVATEKWKQSLISDYIIRNTNDDGSLPPLLTRLAELCLLRSVIDNMTSQKKVKKRSNLTAILDAPLGLFAIGASGRHQLSNIQSTLELAHSFGVQTVLLPISIEEMKRVLFATLNTDQRDRRGLTAAAIRKGELLEAVANDMRANPEKYAKKVGLQVIPRTLDTYPNEEHHFPEQDYTEFSATASEWANSTAGEFHDAECLTITIRARKGKHDRNLFKNDYVFVTSNWRYVNAARKRCLEKFIINEDSCPPVVHFNTFAANVWIAGGFDREKHIPEKTLLAACERALSGHQEVLSKTTAMLSELQLADDATLELFVQDRDCVSAIVSQTGFDPALINEENIEVLLDIAKSAIAKEVREKADAEKKSLEEASKQQLDETKQSSQEQLEAMEEKLEAFKSDVQKTLSERDMRISDLEQQKETEFEQRGRDIGNRVLRLNKKISKHGWGLVEWFETVFFVGASTLMGFKFSLYYGIFASLLGILFVTLSYFEIWFPNKLKNSVLRKYSQIQIRKEFSKHELHNWGIILNEDIEVELKPQVTPSIN